MTDPLEAFGQVKPTIDSERTGLDFYRSLWLSEAETAAVFYQRIKELEAEAVELRKQLVAALGVK